MSQQNVQRLPQHFDIQRGRIKPFLFIATMYPSCVSQERAEREAAEALLTGYSEGYNHGLGKRQELAETEGFLDKCARGLTSCRAILDERERQLKEKHAGIEKLIDKQSQDELKECRQGWAALERRCKSKGERR